MKFDFIHKLFSRIPRLETERLILREMKRADTHDMYEYSKNPRVTEFLLWHEHPDEEYTRRYIDEVISRYKTGEYNDWAIVYRENGKMIGTCGFTAIDCVNSCGEIGYVLNPDYWGMGLATEAARAVVRFGFEKMGLHRIEAKYMKGHAHSRRVMEKCGMQFEGYRRSAMLVKGEYKTIGVCAVLETEFPPEN